jgi:hypothetical protein
LREARKVLEPCIRQAECVLTQPIRDELDATSGFGQSDHVAALELAIKVRDSIAMLLGKPKAYSPNDVHNWLVDVSANLGRLRLGLRAPGVRCTLRSGITFEFEEAARRRDREQRQRPPLPPGGKTGVNPTQNSRR